MNATSNFELDMENKPTYKNSSVANFSRIASLGLQYSGGLWANMSDVMLVTFPDSHVRTFPPMQIRMLGSDGKLCILFNLVQNRHDGCPGLQRGNQQAPWICTNYSLLGQY